MINNKYFPTLQSKRVLNPFITGDELRKQFAISLTAEQIFQSASFQVSASSNEEWVPAASN